MVLSERFGCKAESKEDLEIEGAVEGKSSQQHRHHCRFPFIGQHVEFAVHYKLYASMKPMTVQIIPTVVFDDGTKEGEPALGNSALAWWQFFEICLTGTTAGMEGGEGGVGGGSSEERGIRRKGK